MILNEFGGFIPFVKNVFSNLSEATGMISFFKLIFLPTAIGVLLSSRSLEK